MIKTRLTESLGIEHPVIQAPMAIAAGGKLAAAVSRAGGRSSYLPNPDTEGRNTRDRSRCRHNCCAGGGNRWSRGIACYLHTGPGSG
jgi:hypothetical protein